MSQITAMRLMRDKYNIPLSELSKAANVSTQYLSDLELGKYEDRYNYKKCGEPLMQKAFEIIATNRAEQARRLLDDLDGYRHRLLEFTEGHDEL